MDRSDSEITHIPLVSLPEVILRKIYKHLGPPEYFALRRTCKKSKEWTESYFNSVTNSHMLEQFKNFRFQIVYQNFDSDTQRLEEFVKANLKNITNFFIGNWSFLDIYTDPAFKDLATIYSPKIRKLKITFYLNSDTEQERDFFSSLTSLEELEIETYSIIVADDDREETLLPFLQILKSLKIENIEFQIMGEKRKARNYWFYNLLEVCPKLEVFKMLVIDYRFEDFENNYAAEYALIERGINFSLSLREPGATSLNTIDLNRFQINDGFNKDIEDLYDLCTLHKIKVVNSYWDED